jgi:chromosome partitioning protein
MAETIDWVLVRNRISMLSSRSMRLVQSALEKIAVRLGCRVAEGIAERVIFRSLFPTGYDGLRSAHEELLGGLPSMSHLSARQEYRSLVEALRLPVSDRARARMEASQALARSAAEPAAFEHMAQGAE